ncbi:hypothetical protein [Flavobacterium sp. N2038]|uniref:hypothetical protein n=1 Tax=Flavobacterium sp. N2038 TaxID=2986829 RepID=UPI0022240386|nr:hypothetical protein [Flavobacterium sp. N2038]
MPPFRKRVPYEKLRNPESLRDCAAKNDAVILCGAGANNHNGVGSNQIEGFYNMAGYTTNSFSGNITASNGLPWIANEMRNNRVVQLGWYPDSSVSSGHASLVTRIKYLEDFSKYRIYLIDPASHATSATFDNIYQIFSVKR